MKTITYTLAAAKQLKRLPPDIRSRMIDKLHRYAEAGAGDVTALQGQPGARLRVGDYRLIFVETDSAISVRAVGHRRDIYG
jgi:mRNA interferase RelE/StbE